MNRLYFLPCRGALGSQNLPRAAGELSKRSAISVTRRGTENAPCRAMSDDRPTIEKIAALLGEFFREMAVLLAVFLPLDVYVQGRTLTVRTTVATMAISGGVLALGVFLEVKRWKR